jgi:hypothetical protein
MQPMHGMGGPRIFLRRLAGDEPSGSTQAAAKPICQCSMAAPDARAEVKFRRYGQNQDDRLLNV